MVDCLISSNFRKPKDFSYISKSLDLSYKKQFLVLKKAGFKKIESFAQGVFLKNPTIENYSLFFKACNFKYPSEVCRGLMSVGFTSVSELVTGLYAYGFRHKTTFITALNKSGFRGRDIIAVLEERNILS